MQDRYQTMMDTKRNWLEDRPRLKEDNQDLLQSWLLLYNEVLEMGDETQDYLIQPNDKRLDKLVQEAADVALYIMSFFEIIGVDMYTAVMDKLAQNCLKHKAFYYTNGRTANEGRRDAGIQWKQEKGYDEFYAVGLLGQPFI